MMTTMTTTTTTTTTTTMTMMMTMMMMTTMTMMLMMTMTMRMMMMITKIIYYKINSLNISNVSWRMTVGRPNCQDGCLEIRSQNNSFFASEIAGMITYHPSTKNSPTLASNPTHKQSIPKHLPTQKWLVNPPTKHSSTHPQGTHLPTHKALINPPIKHSSTHPTKHSHTHHKHNLLLVINIRTNLD